MHTNALPSHDLFFPPIEVNPTQLFSSICNTPRSLQTIYCPCARRRDLRSSGGVLVFGLNLSSSPFTTSEASKPYITLQLTSGMTGLEWTAQRVHTLIPHGHTHTHTPTICRPARKQAERNYICCSFVESRCVVWCCGHFLDM